MPAKRPLAARPAYWPGKRHEEQKREAMLSLEQRLAAWTAAVNELYRVQGLDNPRVAARQRKAKERKLLAYEPELSRHLSHAK